MSEGSEYDVTLLNYPKVLRGKIQVEMTNKLVPVSIARTRPRFDGKFPNWLGMCMGNPRLFQLSMGMVMGMYISPPYLRHHLNY